MNMVPVPTQFVEYLSRQPETGMGYYVVSVELHDGRRFEQCVISGGYITQVRGQREVPFNEAEIKRITVTHKKWDFNSERSK